MKIFWHGDAGCNTGFARVVHNIGERLVRDYGHEVHVLAINHRGDDFDSMITPGQRTEMRLYRPNKWLESDNYGRGRIMELMIKLEPDVVILLNDPQVILRFLFENQYDPQRVLLQMRPLLAYIPCDGYNLPPAWPDILTKVTKVVAMSKHGQAAYPGSELVYHGVDTDQFWPVSERAIRTSAGDTLRSKRDCKRAFGFDPEGFLVLRVDKNSGRKDFAATWKALVPVMKRHRDIQVHFHCETDQPSNGVNLNALFSREPSIERTRWFSPDYHNSFDGWPQQDLNALINAADLFVSTSRGEGFGLTLAEASACGVPIIAQNVSAIPEVVGPGGILVEPQRMITVPSGEDNWLADVEAFSNEIEYLYESAGARRSLGEAGVEHVRKSFSWDHAATRFNDMVTALAESAAVAKELVPA